MTGSPNKQEQQQRELTATATTVPFMFNLHLKHTHTHRLTQNNEKRKKLSFKFKSVDFFLPLSLSHIHAHTHTHFSNNHFCGNCMNNNFVRRKFAFLSPIFSVIFGLLWYGVVFGGWQLVGWFDCLFDHLCAHSSVFVRATMRWSLNSNPDIDHRPKYVLAVLLDVVAVLCFGLSHFHHIDILE